MSSIVFANFSGSRPAMSPKLLPDSVGQVAENVYLESGELTPLYNPSVVSALGKTGQINTLYLLGSNWLHWNEQVDVARMPIANNALNRIAFTGTDYPRVTDEQKSAEGGGVNYPEVSYKLGVPAPSSILTVQTVQNPPDGLQIQWDIAGTVQDGIGNRIARVYTYTYVTAWGEEGPPADPSHIVYAGDDDTVEISNFASVPAGPYQISKIRIYRSVSASGVANSYLLVDEVNLPVTPDPFVDTTLTSALGQALTTETWDAPPEAMAGITTMANGILAGFVNNDVYFSEPYQGHAWPTDYVRTLDYKVVGLASVGNMLIAMTEGYPYVITGNHPTFLTINKLEQQQACVSSKSIVEMSDGAMYASAEGLVRVTATSAVLITEGVYPKRDWALLNPSTIHGYFYRGSYIGFHDGGSFQFDLRTGTFITSTVTADAAYSDMVTGKLHLAYLDDNQLNNTLYQYDSDSNKPLRLRWKSKAFESTRINMGAVRVSARGYPIYAEFIVDGCSQTTITIESDEPCRMPASYVGRVFEVEVRSIYGVYSVSIGENMDDLK